MDVTDVIKQQRAATSKAAGEKIGPPTPVPSSAEADRKIHENRKGERQHGSSNTGEEGGGQREEGGAGDDDDEEEKKERRKKRDQEEGEEEQEEEAKEKEEEEQRETYEEREKRHSRERREREKLRRERAAARRLRLPHLVYERTTLETVNMVQSIVSAGIADASRCCALLDKKEGLEVFQQDGWLPPGDDIDGAAWATHTAAGEAERHMFHAITASGEGEGEEERERERDRDRDTDADICTLLQPSLTRSLYSYSTLLSTMLYYTILYYTILYYTICTILSVLYYLYYTILYYTIL